MMQANTMYSLCVFLALLTNLAFGEDGATTICYWSNFRAASVRDALYIDGGTMYKQWPGQETAEQAFGNSTQLESVLYSLNYSTSFDLRTSNLTTIFTQQDEGGPKLVTPMYSGCMFADAYELYTYGGLEPPQVTLHPEADYAFGWEIYNNTPGAVTPVLGATPVHLPDGLTRYTTNGAGVSVPSEKLAFYFSGMTNDNTSFVDVADSGWTAVDQLIEVDMSSFGSPEWSNSTFDNSNILPRADAELVWVPFGAKGALIAIGGVIYPEVLFGSTLSPEQIANSTETSPKFMQNLPVYDIDAKVWFLQEASGYQPQAQLTQFCSVVANDKDTSTYEIYIYGGYNGLQGPGAPSVPPNDDVWVLSVPSFTWTRVHLGNSSDGRYGHYCTTPYPEQMFILGGVGEYGDTPLSSIIKIFNLNTLEWQDSYDPSNYSKTGYQRPAIVANTITNSQPISWSDPAIGNLFSQPYQGNIVTYWPYSGSLSHSTSVAPIAGGAAAGGVCLLVLIGAILWYRRKQHKKPPRAGDAEVQPYDQVNSWRRGVPKTEPSVTTTEIGDTPDIIPHSRGYYAPAEIAGDDNFRRHSAVSPRPGGFAEAGGGTRRISGVPSASPRSPRSPNLGSLDAQEVDGEERYEMEDMHGHRGSGDIGARSRFRDHHLYPLSVSDGDGRSQTSGPSYSGPSHSHSQASRGDANRGVPSPYLMAHPGGTILDDNNNNNNNAELPASPVRPNHLQHTRNISSLSTLGSGNGGGFPQVSPPLEQQANPLTNTSSTSPTPPTHTRTTSEDELDALEAFHTGMVPSRPSHKRNPSSMSSRLNQLPTPAEELTEAERNRQSTLLAKLPSPTVGAGAAASPANSPYFEQQQQSPLLGAASASVPGNDAERERERELDGRSPPASPSPVVGGNGNTTNNAGHGGVMVGDELYSPSYYSQGSTLVTTPRSPISRRPVGKQGFGVDRGFSSGGHEGDMGKGGGKGGLFD